MELPVESAQHSQKSCFQKSIPDPQFSMLALVRALARADTTGTKRERESQEWRDVKKLHFSPCAKQITSQVIVIFSNKWLQGIKELDSNQYSSVPSPNVHIIHWPLAKDWCFLRPFPDLKMDCLTVKNHLTKSSSREMAKRSKFPVLPTDLWNVPIWFSSCQKNGIMLAYISRKCQMKQFGKSTCCA